MKRKENLFQEFDLRDQGKKLLEIFVLSLVQRKKDSLLILQSHFQKKKKD